MSLTKPHEVREKEAGKRAEETFIVLCASGFNNIARARSALMFATLAASADYKTVLFCVQDGVDFLVKGAVEKNEVPKPGVPTLAQRLREAIEMGVEIQSCSQTMQNRKVSAEDLVPGVTVAGAMNLVVLASSAKGTLSF